MARKMLIDSTHAEETRVVVVNGNKVEEFDFDSSARALITGNIYLAKVSRIEPSLQAAFVDYGGNRQGFLAFSEIHPDYYQIPQADREALMAEELERQAEEAEEEESEDEKRAEENTRKRSRRGRRGSRKKTLAQEAKDDVVQGEIEENADEANVSEETTDSVDDDKPQKSRRTRRGKRQPSNAEETITDQSVSSEASEEAPAPAIDAEISENSDAEKTSADEGDEKAEESHSEESKAETSPLDDPRESDDEDQNDADDVEEVENDKDDVEADIRPKRRATRRTPPHNRYKIQEVLKPRQILLVQVVKEERGNKGAALTTYISLPGRYCVLMPNTGRGGGISRKINNVNDRKRLRSLAKSFNVPKGAGLIIRTAGAKQDSEEIERDYAFLTRQWNQIRELTLSSTAPAPVYEESGPIKRAIRDLLTNDTDEILIEGDAGYQEAREYMEVLMPERVKSVKQYNNKLPLFSRYQVENYLSSMFNPTVQLKSGGYLVIGVTEALVAIDVNSGRSTKEASIEDTALKTNLEAAEEVARQLKLRDLAGLIVIDFIDMEQYRHQQDVENKLKDCLRKDRARIQVGRISSFGLLEMSRQRLRTGLVEAITAPCPHCNGTGITRSPESLALHVIRAIEEEIARGRANEIDVQASTSVANFLFNEKRDHIFGFLERYGVLVRITADPTMIEGEFNVEKIKNPKRPMPKAEPVSVASIIEQSQQAEESDEDGKSNKRRRKRGGRGRNRKNQNNGENQANDEVNAEAAENASTLEGENAEKPKRKRRSKADVEAEKADKSESVEKSDGEEAKDEKPKRKRRSKAEIEAEKAEKSESLEISDGEEVKAEKPKRKRRTKAEIEAEKAEKSSKPEEKAEPEAKVQTKTEGHDGGEEKAEKPKRKRRTKAEIEAEKAEKSEEAKPVTSKEAAVNVEVKSTSVEPPAATKSDKPKRKGWWSN